MNHDELVERGHRLALDLEVLHERYGQDETLWPAGIRQRADNIARGLRAVDRDLTDLETRERRRDEIMDKVRSGEAILESGAPTAPSYARMRSNPWAGLDPSLRGESPDGFRARALDAIEVVPGLPTASRAKLTAMVDSDPTAGSAMFVAASSDPHYRSAFEKVLRDPIQGHLLWSDSERDAFGRVQHTRAALSLVDANGGYLVPLTLDPSAVLTNVGSTNPFRRIARIETTVTEDWNGTTSAGVTAEWLAEGAEAADASPTFGRATITPAKLSAYVFGSYEVLMDTNLADQLPRIIQDSFDNAEAAAFATGSGSGAPKGVVTAVTAVTASRVSPTTAGSFTSASIADIYAVHNALTARARNHPSAAWVANNTVLNVIRRMGESAGGPGASFWANLNDGTPARLLGIPVYESSAMTSTITTGSNILLCGSFVDYAVIDRVGTTLVYDSMVLGSNRRPTGQAGWLAFKRVGGDCLNVDSFRILRL